MHPLPGRSGGTRPTVPWSHDQTMSAIPQTELRRAPRAKASLPPGPRLPRLAQTWFWLHRPTEFMERCQAQFGDVFTLRLAMGNDLVLMAKPELVKAVFTGDNDVLHAGEANAAILEPILGTHSVLVLDGPEHLRQRKLMLPAFHGERMKKWGGAIAEITAEEVARWPHGRPMPTRPAMQSITLDVIRRVVFGLDQGTRADQVRDVILEIASMSQRPFRLFALMGHDFGGRSPWARFVRARTRLHELLQEEIDERRVAGDLESRDDVASQLLLARDEDGNPMRDEEVRDELVTLLFAGHETTATSLAWTFDLLVHNPDAMRKLEDEVLHGQGTDYLDAVIKETMRMRPVVVIVDRRVKAPVRIGDLELPVGANACPAIYLTHMREDIYPEAKRFRPERFFEQAAEPYSLLPFGGGIRRCLGASFANYEMKVVIPEVLRRCRLEPAGPPSRPRREAVTLVPEDGARVVVRGR